MANVVYAMLLAASLLYPAIAHAGAASPPNILVIMLDDAGYAQADTFGGEIHTPTMTRIADSGIAYNSFHTTAVCSATRASLLTGRNHHGVGNGTVTGMADESLDGYTGIIPPSAATIPQLLKQKGYASAAFGKWHNTPVVESGPKGPFTRWPTGYGFDYFYGFVGGESDQYRPRLFDGTKPIEPPRNATYHLTEDIADKAVQWLDRQHATAPEKPFFMYWTPGGVHAPHQVFPQWSNKYKGKFDSGWDAYRQRAFARQKAMGWIPADTVNAPRPEGMPAWDGLSNEEKIFQARLMEVYAGFLEHTDTQAGKIVDALERLGLRKNTLIFYVFSDNGASSEGSNGTINDMAVTNGITKTSQQSMQVLNDTYGGLDALGGPKVAEHYAAPWAWAGESPFVGTKLIAGYFGGTRTPLAVSWPASIAPNKQVRSQFHHVNDIASTIYEVVGITPPTTFGNVKQEPFDGVSMAYTFKNASAPGQKQQQYFELMGSRAEYADGWVASVFGPRKPWVANQAELLSWSGKLAYVLKSPWIGQTFGWLKWKPEDDRWSLYDLKSDFSQSNDVAAQYPAKLAELRKKFEADAQANHVNPIGGSFNRALMPRPVTQTEWRYDANDSRLPEQSLPNIKSHDNIVTVEADFPAKANGVLFSLGSISGGIALFVKDGYLMYEYNFYGFDRTIVQSPQPLPAGRASVSVELKMGLGILSVPANITMAINGQEVASGKVPVAATRYFTATGTLDIGADLGTGVSLQYYDQVPFAFNGKIKEVVVRYK
jgi:arylsulfatase